MSSRLTRRTPVVACKTMEGADEGAGIWVGLSQVTYNTRHIAESSFADLKSTVTTKMIRSKLLYILLLLI